MSARHRGRAAISAATEADVKRMFSKTLPRDGDGCLLWNGSVNNQGYGTMKVRRVTILAHRLSLTAAAGEPPEVDAEAAHTCGNKRCVAPEHLRWATHTENMADQLAHGTRARGETNGQARLTEKQVLLIQRIYQAGGISQRALATRFGVSQRCISDLLLGRRWRHLPREVKS